MDSATFLAALKEMPLFPQVIVLQATKLQERVNDEQRAELLELLKQQYEQFVAHNEKVVTFEQEARTRLNQLKEEYLVREGEADAADLERAEGEL